MKCAFTGAVAAALGFVRCAHRGTLFVDEVASAYDEPVNTLSPAAEAALMRYDWPGNVRELRNAIERAFLFCADRTIDVIHLPNEVRDAAATFSIEGSV